MKRLRRVVLLLFAVGAALSPLTIAQAPAADAWLAKPVDDQTFQTYLDFFAYDKKLPLDLRVIDTEEKDGVKREHLSFQSTRGVRVFAHFYRPAAAASRQWPSVILLHGGGPAGKDNPGIQLLAPLIARGGTNVLAIDMPNFGERGTDLLTTFTEQEKHDRLYNQPSVYLGWVTQTVKDVSRAFDLLVEQRGADAKRIAVIGMSRGAIVAAIAGASDRRLGAVAML
jgi:dipeptidyl aminopeptidase/acylaminoacyl peptidase